MSLLRKFLVYTNLRSGMDEFQTIHESIEKDVMLRGTRLWVLVIAIFIVSIGLNMNSTSVIIGAMLISPMIGPINGMGYSIATYNFPLFRKAIKNFGFAVVAALSTSTIYFTLSPLSVAHSELLSQTSTTIYDVLIAFLGGLAGIIAISSKSKGNIIAGAAIATALMPPLCTAGYGLANGNLNFFLSAMYLFTINVVFIAISSVLICRFLKFPISSDVQGKHKTRVQSLLSFVMIITLIPSVYFGYALVQREHFSEDASRFVADISVFEGSYLLKNEVDARKKQIILVYGGSDLSQKNKEEIAKRASVFSLSEAKLIFKQGFSFNEGKENINQIDKLKTEVNRLNLALKENQKTTDSIISKPKIGKQLLGEIKTLFPEIKSCSYSETVAFQDSTKVDKVKIVVMETTKKGLTSDARKRINDWLKKRLESEKVKTFFE